MAGPIQPIAFDVFRRQFAVAAELYTNDMPLRGQLCRQMIKAAIGPSDEVALLRMAFADEENAHARATSDTYQIAGERSAQRAPCAASREP